MMLLRFRRLGILTIFFNRQIMKYLDTNALAVYGIVAYVSTFVQCCAYSAGQAAQPIISTNYGARQGGRIRETLRYALLTIGPSIIRRYCVSFLLLPLNIFSTYYFQALMKPGTSFIVSVSRGAVISGLLIYLLPVAAGANAIWFAMPIMELLVGIYVTVMMFRITKQLENETRQARRI